MKTAQPILDKLQADTLGDSPRHIVYKFWTAVEKRDLGAVAAIIDDEMTWEVMYIGHLMPGGSTYQGKRVIVEELLPFVFSAYPGKYEFEMLAMYVDGNTVVIEFCVNAVTARGRPYEDVRYISVIKVENGKIKSAREYLDGLKAKAAHFD